MPLLRYNEVVGEGWRRLGWDYFTFESDYSSKLRSFFNEDYPREAIITLTLPTSENDRLDIFAMEENVQLGSTQIKVKKDKEDKFRPAIKEDDFYKHF